MQRDLSLHAGLDEWEALVHRAPFMLAHDCGLTRAGETICGWLCPGPDCGIVEPTDLELARNHGTDPTVPNWADEDEPWRRSPHSERERKRVAAGRSWIDLPTDHHDRTHEARGEGEGTRDE